MKGWLLIETLLVLLVANAIAWFVVAMRSSLAHPRAREPHASALATILTG